MGHDYLEDIWNEFTPDELDEDLGSVLMVLTFFASPKLAKAYHKEGKGNRSLDQHADTVVTVFSDAIREYAHLGRSIYQARREAGSSRPRAAGSPQNGAKRPLFMRQRQEVQEVLRRGVT